MNYEDAMEELKALGSEQTRKTYRRHGVEGDLYGVSYAALGALKKRIKVDQVLAERLWESGNHDARLLATMVGDPSLVKAAVLDRWAKELSNYPITDAFAGFAARTPYARGRMEKWSKSGAEMVGRAGWLVLARLAASDAELDDSYFETFLETIERDIHSRKNRVKDAMNSALIAIGLRSPGLQKKALASAKRIGKVEVDHGETNCKTPDASDYILKAAGRRAK
ncbi:MAG TPA: DNA alkylation repair protein [Blastocatellia bacterium]|nr:DNA alkylation repair protein [Blastocatellia bacterium]